MKQQHVLCIILIRLLRVSVCPLWDLGNRMSCGHTSFTSAKSFTWRLAQTAWRVLHSNARWWTLHLPFSAVWTYDVWNHAHHFQYRIHEGTCNTMNHLWMGIYTYSPKLYGLLSAVYNTDPFVNGSPSVDLRGRFVNGGAIHEWASIIATILQVIQCTINYGPILEWASYSPKYYGIIQYNTNYRPIREWESILAKLLRIVN